MILDDQQSDAQQPAQGLIPALNLSDPSQATDPAQRALYDYWLSNRDAAGRFHYAAFDVTELPPSLVPLIYLVRVHGEARRFEVRIVGQQVIELAGVNHMGRFIDELPGSAPTQARMEFCLDRNLPYTSSGPLDWGLYPYKSYSVCAVPLHDQGGRVAYILSVVRVHGLPAGDEAQAHRFLTASNLPKAPSPILDEAFAYWLGKRESTEIPRRTAIDPIEIPRLLPHLMLIDVLRDPLDFRYRLIGEGIRENMHRGRRGRSFRELEGKGPGSHLWKGLQKVVETGIPRFGRAPYAGPERRVKQFFDLLLPLSEDGETVSQILVATEFRQ